MEQISNKYSKIFLLFLLLLIQYTSAGTIQSSFSINPQTVAPGGQASVTLTLTNIDTANNNQEFCINTAAITFTNYQGDLQTVTTSPANIHYCICPPVAYGNQCQANANSQKAFESASYRYQTSNSISIPFTIQAAANPTGTTTSSPGIQHNIEIDLNGFNVNCGFGCSVSSPATIPIPSSIYLQGQTQSQQQADQQAAQQQAAQQAAAQQSAQQAAAQQASQAAAQQAAAQQAAQQAAAQAAAQQAAIAAAKASANTAISDAANSINLAISAQNNDTVTVNQAGTFCTTAQADWTAGGTLLTSAKSSDNSAQSKIQSGDYAGAQTDATTSKTTALQAQSQFDASIAAANSCIAQAKKQQEALQAAGVTVTSAQNSIQQAETLSALANELGVSSIDGDSFQSSAKDELTLAQGSLSAGDAAGAQSHAALSISKAKDAQTAYSKIDGDKITQNLNSEQASLNGIKNQISSNSLKQDTSDQQAAITQSTNLLAQGDYAGASTAADTAQAKITDLNSTVNSSIKQINDAKNQQINIIVIAALILTAGVNPFFRTTS